jgi:hypothetical protein
MVISMVIREVLISNYPSRRDPAGPSGCRPLYTTSQGFVSHAKNTPLLMLMKRRTSAMKKQLSILNF